MHGDIYHIHWLRLCQLEIQHHLHNIPTKLAHTHTHTYTHHTYLIIKCAYIYNYIYYLTGNKILYVLWILFTYVNAKYLKSTKWHCIKGVRFEYLSDFKTYYNARAHKRLKCLCDDRKTEQWNRRKSRNKPKHTWPVYFKARWPLISTGKRKSFQQMVLEHLVSTWKRLELMTPDFWRI